MNDPTRWSVYLAIVVIVALTATDAVRVPPSDLTGLVFVLTALAWLSAVVLGRAALQPPRIGSLTERAVIAVVIALLGTVACTIILNTDAGQPLFDGVAASRLFRISILGVLALPSGWLILWFLGRLGTNGEE